MNLFLKKFLFYFALLAFFAGPTPFAAAASMFPVGPIYITTTSASNQTWPVPSDWNNASNTVEVIAAGGGGGGITSTQTGTGGGGGGGGYSKSVNITLSGSMATYFLPAGGVGGGTSAATAGKDAWFNGTTCAGASVCAKGGGGGGAGTGGGGGAAGAGGLATGGIASGTGSIKNNGGAGGAGVTVSAGGGGGGAGGPSAAGGVGNNTYGGQGDGTAGGAGGMTSVIRAAFAGSPGTEFSSSPAYGSGGGGGGSRFASDAAGGGTYGAGGGGAFATASGNLRNGGAGAPGLIVINYNAPLTVSITAPANSGNACIGTPGAFTLTRNGPTTLPAVRVDIAYSGTAAAGIDYAPAPTTLTIPANTTSVTIPVTALQKTSGTNTTLTATIAASSTYSIGTPASASMTINNAPPTIETVSNYSLAPFATYSLPQNSYVYHEGAPSYTNPFATPASILNTWINSSPSPELCGNTYRSGISVPSDVAQGLCMGTNFSATPAGTRVGLLTALPQLGQQMGELIAKSIGLDLVNITKPNACGVTGTHWAYATAPIQNTPTLTLKVPKYTPVQLSYSCLPNQNYIWFTYECQGIGSCIGWTLVRDHSTNFQTADRAWYNDAATTDLVESFTQTFSASQNITLQCGGYQPQEGTPATGGTPPATSGGNPGTGNGYVLYGLQNASYQQPQIQVSVQVCSDSNQIVSGGVCTLCGSGKYRSGNTCVPYAAPTATIQANDGGFSDGHNGNLVSVAPGQPITIAATYSSGVTNPVNKGPIYLASAASPWTPLTPGGSPIGVAASADGTKLAVAAFSSIYTSTDSGATWTPRTVTGATYLAAITSSSNGTTLVAVEASGSVWYSLNSGQNWTKSNAPAKSYYDVASSKDGTKLVTGDAAGSGYIYTSINSGVAWTSHLVTGAPSWTAFASSESGTKLVAVASNNGIYVSADSGATWTKTSAPAVAWVAAASSADGTKLVAAAQNGYIYISNDSGATWVAQSGSSGPGLHTWGSAQGGYTPANNVTSSDNGMKLVASADDNNYIYLSVDGGATWTPQADAGVRYWGPPFISADGSRIWVTESAGNIYAVNFPVWTAPDDWSIASNTVEVIGGGGTAGLNGTSRGGGGGGGAYSKGINLLITPGSLVQYSAGAGGAKGSPAAAGGDTYFNAISMSACTSAGGTLCVSAKGGGSGNGATAGTGGAASSGVGSASCTPMSSCKYSGGNGAAGGTSGGGGGGAGGPQGNGVNANANNGGAGNAGSAGGGAGGAGGNPPTAAGNGTKWDASHGPGGGGGARTVSTSASGGVGGSYGGGGGSGTGTQANEGVGAQGLIVINYTTGDPLTATAINDDATSVSVPCVNIVPLNNPGCETKPDATKTYTLPSGINTSGLYTFSAQAKTSNYTNYNSYATVQVRVCAVGEESNGSGGCQPADKCSDITGYQSSVPNGCQTPATFPGQCIPSEAGWSYNYATQQCMNIPSLPMLNANSFTASRVRAGQAATLLWSIPNMASGISCKIDDPIPASGTDLTTGDITYKWDGSSNPFTGQAITIPITAPTKYTLTCTNQVTSASKSVIVNIIPSFQEI